MATARRSSHPVDQLVSRLERAAGWSRASRSVTQMPEGHLGGPLEFRLR
jgi:hypothetical protein